MKHIFIIALAAVSMLATTAQAQEWDREKYPDYDPTFCNPEPSLLRFGTANTRRKARAMAESEALPDHWNNADTKYFPPIFNQDGGSCGSASRIGYMFTHELNAYRGTSAQTMDRMYPTHFVWLLTNGNSGKDEFVQFVGVPSAQTYGGRTYSKLFGYQEETNDDFGWMTGYDKWFEGFSNRMLKPTSNPFSLATEEGRLAAKAWLYNHAGDNDFHAGGLIGLGVASGGQWRTIPRTAANDAAGASGMYYVKEWGVSVDHAVTLVGYDDRIEFDLDGNGIVGEEDKDERGAWIIANSWGGWCNAGFIYCPYAFAGASFNNDGEAGHRTFNKNSWWYGELYKVRKDYRPLRTIKLRMRYSRRSELLLQAGVSANLDATEPDEVIDMHHFRHAGDGNYGNGTRNQTGTNENGKPIYVNTGIAPSMPMLGRWADGKTHSEDMEFGYDLTDLTATCDRNKPLKYFFIVNTSDNASGVGRVTLASIIDYEYDRNGVETPFDLGEKGYTSIQNKGGKTIISVIVYGAAYNAVNNLALTSGTLSWTAPDRSSHTLQAYNIRRDGTLLQQVDAATTTFAVGDAGDATYTVTALYADGVESDAATVSTPVAEPSEQLCCDYDLSGFEIPGIFDSNMEQCTIEYWIRPNTFANWNNAAGPGWGKWLQHFNENGTMSVGWNSASGQRVSTSSFTLNEWQHVCIVVNKNRISVYRNGNQVGTCTSTSYSGIGGWGDYTFYAQEGNNYHQQAMYDELRIWNVARTATQVRAAMNSHFYGEAMPTGLVSYYRGDTFQKDGQWYMRDCVSGHHARILTPGDKQALGGIATATPAVEATASIVVPKHVLAGQPVTLSANRSDAINQLLWSVPSAGLQASHAITPTVVFPTAGKHSVSLTATDYAGTPHTQTIEVEVEPAAALDARFRCTAQTVPAGERISFVPETYVPGCTYQWQFPGADVEQVDAISAAASYSQVGTYTVTLTVTDAAGNQATQQMQVSVEAVAPVAQFDVSQTILLKGETVRLTSTSKYDPTAYQWVISSASGTTVVQNGRATLDFTPTESGAYTVSLKATNAVGSHTATMERAFVVVNADSKNGLAFSSSNSGTTGYLTFPTQPIPAGSTTFTIDFWLNPAHLTDECLGMGESASTMLLRANAKGEIVFSLGGKTVSSFEAYIVEGEWHHYCITHSSAGVVFFFRDGKLICQSPSGAVEKAMPQCGTFRLGTEDAPMTGSIDELRFWLYSMNEERCRLICNVPATDESLQGQTWYSKLTHYYDFNQSGGDVQDRIGDLHAQRVNFGPDGDAWGLSRGVFALDFGTAAAGVDVTSTYLVNYKKSFQRTTTLVNNSVASRFFQLRDWTLENTATADGIVSGAHVDTQKASCFTVTTGWDGFPALTNHKAFQTVTLPAGIYTLSCTFGQHGAAGNSYLVAAAGGTLPNIENLDAEALGYAPLADATMTFIVPESTDVSLGIVTSMTGNSIFTIDHFTLLRSDVDIIDAIQDVLPDTTTPAASAGIYTIQGVRLSPGTRAEQLRRGLYIINGRKVAK